MCWLLIRRATRKGNTSSGVERSRREGGMKQKARRVRLRFILIAIGCIGLAIVKSKTELLDTVSIKPSQTSTRDSILFYLKSIWNSALIVMSSLFMNAVHLLHVLKTFLSSIDYSYYVSAFKEMYDRMPVVSIILLVGGLVVSTTILLFLIYIVCKLFLTLSDKSESKLSTRESTPGPSASSRTNHSYGFGEKKSTSEAKPSRSVFSIVALSPFAER